MIGEVIRRPFGDVTVAVVDEILCGGGEANSMVEDVAWVENLAARFNT